MHPLLASGRRFLLYIAAWISAAALLAWAMRASGGISWAEAAAVLAPACLLYAFACLSPWYICRTRPLSVATAPGTAVTFAAAAAGAGLAFVGCATLAAHLLGRVARFHGVEGRIGTHLPLLFGVAVPLYLLSAGLHYAALAMAESRAAERRASEARTLAREAELLVLRMQVNPHFLFNSLHSVASLAVTDGERARDMCVRLADFLRGSLRLGERETVPLEEELALARGYLEVERVRFGERLRFTEDVAPECGACAIPALLLQPLVENAVKHGIAGLVAGGEIRLRARLQAGEMVLSIENPYDRDARAPASMGRGLEQVRRRLQARHGGQAALESGGDGGVYRVVLRLPCESPMACSSRA